MLGLVCCVSALAAETVVERLDIQQPRSFGYQIGDRFERTVTLQLRHPYRLLVDTLPAAGRLTEWLACETPQLAQTNLGGSMRYDIRLIYQIVNISPDLHDIALPHHELRYGDGKETLTLLIPAWRVGVAALHLGTGGQMQGDRVPWSLPLPYFRPILCATVLLLSVLGLGYLHWGLPVPATHQPFTRAYWQARKWRQQGWDDERYRAALLLIHKAFNETAGKTVFADALAAFFDDHLQFASARQPVTDFFLRSRRYFFAGTRPDDGERYSYQDMVAFVQLCSNIERGLA